MQTIEVPVKDYVRMHDADLLLQEWAKRCHVKDQKRRLNLRLVWADKFIQYCKDHQLFINTGR